MNNLINIGIPSKGRLRADVLKIFKKKKLRIISERGERDLIGSIKNKPYVKILYLHAREIIERLGDSSLDIGFSGFDLLKESGINVQNKIEEIAFEFRDIKKKRIRVATKYPNLTQDFLFSKGVTQFRLVESLGATEAYPFTGSAELITDITSTGETLKANNLRILKDGEILKSEACLLTSKKNVKKKRLNNLIKLLSK